VDHNKDSDVEADVAAIAAGMSQASTTPASGTQIALGLFGKAIGVLGIVLGLSAPPNDHNHAIGPKMEDDVSSRAGSSMQKEGLSRNGRRGS
jgi:hypothetical protein